MNIPILDNSEYTDEELDAVLLDAHAEQYSSIIGFKPQGETK